MTFLEEMIFLEWWKFDWSGFEKGLKKSKWQPGTHNSSVSVIVWQNQSLPCFKILEWLALHNCWFLDASGNYIIGIRGEKSFFPHCPGLAYI